MPPIIRPLITFATPSAICLVTIVARNPSANQRKGGDGTSVDLQYAKPEGCADSEQRDRDRYSVYEVSHPAKNLLTQHRMKCRLHRQGQVPATQSPVNQTMHIADVCKLCKVSIDRVRPTLLKASRTCEHVASHGQPSAIMKREAWELCSRARALLEHVPAERHCSQDQADKAVTQPAVQAPVEVRDIEGELRPRITGQLRVAAAVALCIWARKGLAIAWLVVPAAAQRSG